MGPGAVARLWLSFSDPVSLEMNYEYEKYKTSSSNLWVTLEKYGVAIMPSVLSEDECDEMVDGMWSTLGTLTEKFVAGDGGGQIQRDDETTWCSLYELIPQHSMLIQHWGIGHAQYLWNLRQNPKILKIWADFWEVEPNELLVSFDAVSYHLPPETTGRGWFVPRVDRPYGWMHTDQSHSPGREGFECVQSWVTGLDVNDGDATITILEGSHLYHAEFAREFGKTDKGDWGPLKSEEEYNFYIKGSPTRPPCPRRCIKCPKGSIVFWDSRTIHAGQEPLKTRAEPNIRCVAYLCYSPRYLATNAALKKKLKHFEERRTTNHWPHRPHVFPIKPGGRWVPKDSLPNVVALPKPNISSIGYWLAGWVGDLPEKDDEGYARIDFY